MNVMVSLINKKKIKTEYNKFNSFAEKYEQFVSNSLGTPWFGWDDLSGKRAIDIGCGAGQAAKVLSEKFEKVIGLDLCAELIDLAKKKHSNPNITYIIEDFMKFESEENFDFVYSHTMMHHLENYEEGLLKMKSLVSKGGKLVIIDNVSDKYPTPPEWVYTLPAKIEFIPNIFKIGIKKAWFLFTFWHNKEWLNHLASDTYLSRKEFNELYTKVFPDSEIVDLGFANAVKWIK
ncbi:MAG TPA: class I SAM-dependent methyltransferase [Treponemataceae bacterium]|jgi:ubiquinone/menaquinone biosynthesis C-methylase UbiE|nr:class I SAM-dependent methyltransferase [Treponemataceae bacterium]